jgi:hypothetical protein
MVRWAVWQPIFVAMFERYRGLYLYMFQLHLASYVVSFGVRLREAPLFMAAMLLLVMAALKPYVCLGDYGLAFGVLLLHDKVVAMMRHKWLLAFLFGWWVHLGVALG